MIDIVPYTDDMAAQWDKFISVSGAANFLYTRSYLEHHTNKFHDSSVFITRNQKIEGIFPAVMIDNQAISHPGITYGGLITSNKITAGETLLALREIIKFYAELGADEIIYKMKPPIYSDRSSQDDSYALFVLKALLIRRDLSSIIDMENKSKLPKGKIWSINKAKKKGIKIMKAENLDLFYKVLLANLKDHKTKPTHSLHELQYLMAKFPKNIALYVADLKGAVLAGAVVYDFGRTVHTQYLATTEEGRVIGALDHTINFLITAVYPQKRFFSFGISTEEGGTVLNEGLLRFKKSFGSYGLTHDFYRLPITKIDKTARPII